MRTLRSSPFGKGTLLAMVGPGLVLLVFCGRIAAGTIRLPRTGVTFFMEDDQAYARFLCLESAGSYRQIDTGFGSSREVDRGTWDQSTSGEVVLRPTNGALTFRAISAGPLLLSLDTQSQIDAAPGLARAMTAFLEAFRDEAFSRQTLEDLENQTGAKLALQNGVDSFERGDFDELLRRLGLWMQNRASGEVVFDLVDQTPAPPLLIQRGAVFSKTSVEAIRRKYHVPRRGSPPFYFARIDVGTFQARAGRWQAFDNLGGMHFPVEPSAPIR